MNEASLKGELARRLRARGAVVFAHNDRVGAGVPDLSATVTERTWWVEVKARRFATWPTALSVIELTRGRQAQLVNMVRLARLAYARYLVFVIVRDAWRAYLLRPDAVREAVASVRPIDLTDYVSFDTFEALEETFV